MSTYVILTNNPRGRFHFDLYFMDEKIRYREVNTACLMSQFINCLSQDLNPGSMAPGLVNLLAN